MAVRRCTAGDCPHGSRSHSSIGRRGGDKSVRTGRHLHHGTIEVLLSDLGHELEIVAAHRDLNVLAVSHEATVRLLESALLGLEPRLYRDHLDQSPGALNIIDFKDSMHARLTLFNDTSHDAEAGLAISAPPCADLSKWWDSPTGSERGGRPRRESPPPNAS